MQDSSAVTPFISYSIYEHTFITQFSSIKAHLHTHLSDLTLCMPHSAKNPSTWRVSDEEAKGENNGLSVRL